MQALRESPLGLPRLATCYLGIVLCSPARGKGSVLFPAFSRQKRCGFSHSRPRKLRLPHTLHPRSTSGVQRRSPEAALVLGEVPPPPALAHMPLRSAAGSEDWRGNLAQDAAPCFWEGIDQRQMEEG